MASVTAIAGCFAQEVGGHQRRQQAAVGRDDLATISQRFQKSRPSGPYVAIDRSGVNCPGRSWIRNQGSDLPHVPSLIYVERFSAMDEAKLIPEHQIADLPSVLVNILRLTHQQKKTLKQLVTLIGGELDNAIGIHGVHIDRASVGRRMNHDERMFRLPQRLWLCLPKLT